MKIFTKKLVPYIYMYAAMILICLTQTLSTNAQVRMRANLHIVDANGTTLMDGNMTNYNNIYSNAIDGYDIWKMSNFGENFGILRSTANLVVERRALITSTDTTYFRMWNMQQRNYRIQVIAEKLHNSNLMGFVRDSYLNQDFPIDLNDTTDINFTVNAQAGSAAADRFKLIYVNLGIAAGTLPVNFTGITASRKSNNIQLSFSVANEINMHQYVVQHSADGRLFKDITTIAPSGAGSSKTYQTFDVQTASAAHFYRIKGISIGGKEQYSVIAKVSAQSNLSAIQVYPNPITGKSMQIELNNTVAGMHQLVAISNIGQRFVLPALKIAGTQQMQTVQLPGSMAPGIYRLQVTAPDAKVFVKTIVVL